MTLDDDMNEAAPLTGSPVGGVLPSRPQRSCCALGRLLAVTVVLAGATAFADIEGIELERLTPNPGATGSLLLGTGELLPQRGYLAASPPTLASEAGRSISGHQAVGELLGGLAA